MLGLKGHGNDIGTRKVRSQVWLYKKSQQCDQQLKLKERSMSDATEQYRLTKLRGQGRITPCF
jgi:hypothetical protein